MLFQKIWVYLRFSPIWCYGKRNGKIVLHSPGWSSGRSHRECDSLFQYPWAFWKSCQDESQRDLAQWNSASSDSTGWNMVEIEQKKNHSKVANSLIFLVAGVGFEPTTFRLWAWRATGLLHPASKTSQLAINAWRNKKPPEVQALQAVKASNMLHHFAKREKFVKLV